MKSVSIKRIEVSSNGTISFSFSCLANFKQVSFHEKDFINSQFFIKPTKAQTSQSSVHTSYKSKYKF